MALTHDSLLDYLGSRMGVDTGQINDATPLFSSSILDSFSIVDLIMFVETEAGIHMDTWDVTLDNLDSIERILRYAEMKKLG